MGGIVLDESRGIWSWSCLYVFSLFFSLFIDILWYCDFTSAFTYAQILFVICVRVRVYNPLGRNSMYA